MKPVHDLDNAGLGAVLRTALDAVVVMRLDGTVAGWNEVAERTFGWSCAEALGRRMSDLIIPERFRAMHERGLALFLETGAGPVIDRHIEIEALHRDGHEIPVELSITRTEQFGEPVFLGFLRDISERIAAAMRQELLIGELNHRAKNLLAVVAGIAHQTARNATSLSDFSHAFEGRLVSLGQAHEIVNAAAWEAAPLGALVARLLGPGVGAAARQVSFGGPDVLLPPRHLLSVSMILHELLTNALKHGALALPSGLVSLRWARLPTDGSMLLVWAESGVAGLAPPTRRGFGTRMIQTSVSRELHGSVTTTWGGDGMVFELAFPLEAAGNASPVS